MLILTVYLFTHLLYQYHLSLIIDFFLLFLLFPTSSRRNLQIPDFRSPKYLQIPILFIIFILLLLFQLLVLLVGLALVTKIQVLLQKKTQSGGMILIPIYFVVVKLLPTVIICFNSFIYTIMFLLQMCVLLILLELLVQYFKNSL